MLALEPPGNIARDLNLYRRQIFSSFAQGSALAFPDALPLAFASPPVSSPASKRSSIIERAWEGVEGRFSASGLIIAEASFYLKIVGPLSALLANAVAAMAALGCAGTEEPIIMPGIGFFLCSKPEGKGSVEEGPSLFHEILPDPPALAFVDCSLVLFGLRLSADPFAAASWHELARSRRRSGPPISPSGRLKRGKTPR